MDEAVRVRYAPSPTGDPHVGNIRSALFNWLLARRLGGKFILRIEDTDQSRKIDGSVKAILDSLQWLGIDWDEGPDVGGEFGPYTQSDRVEIYLAAANRLVESDNAYYCYCASERLVMIRESQKKQNRPTGYDGRCRNLSALEREEEIKKNPNPVVRFKVPLTGKTTFNDVIRGDVTWENRLLDDFVLLKSDGYPTYHLASVVDDNAMKISHVLRADEWLPSTPRHVLLYEAFGWKPPIFAHLPLILGSDRSKLSKRHGSVSMMDYKDQGYLPDAMLNFLSLLGWSLDDKTTEMDISTVIENFSLERIGASPAVFDLEKLSWLNGVYLRNLSADSLAEKSFELLDRDLGADVSRPLDWAYVVKVCSVIQDRARTFSEIPHLASFFFSEDYEYPVILIWAGMGDKSVKKLIEATEDAGTLSLPEDWELVTDSLAAASVSLSKIDDWSHDILEATLRSLVEEIGTSNRRLFGAMRVVLTGRTEAPPLFSTMEILGKKVVLDRLERGVGLLNDSSK